MDLTRPWCFDKNVAEEFEEHARQNIPGYEKVVLISLQLALATCGKDDPIAEVGCATGYTLRRFEAAGFENLLGVDNAPAMLDRCEVHHARLLCSSDFPVTCGPFRLVLLNWTLHFIHPDRRLDYLRSLVGALRTDGFLIITEKTHQSPLMTQLYEDFKRAQGMSDEAIDAKKKSLIGVLDPLPHQWYSNAFESLGLTYEILLAQLGFVTYLVRLASSKGSNFDYLKARSDSI